MTLVLYKILISANLVPVVLYTYHKVAYFEARRGVRVV